MRRGKPPGDFGDRLFLRRRVGEKSVTDAQGSQISGKKFHGNGRKKFFADVSAEGKCLRGKSASGLAAGPLFAVDRDMEFFQIEGDLDTVPDARSDRKRRIDKGMIPARITVADHKFPVDDVTRNGTDIFRATGTRFRRMRSRGSSVRD